MPFHVLSFFLQRKKTQVSCHREVLSFEVSQQEGKVTVINGARKYIFFHKIAHKIRNAHKYHTQLKRYTYIFFTQAEIIRVVII